MMDVIESFEPLDAVAAADVGELDGFDAGIVAAVAVVVPSNGSVTPAAANVVRILSAGMGRPFASGKIEKITTTEPWTTELMRTRSLLIAKRVATSCTKCFSAHKTRVKSLLFGPKH